MSMTADDHASCSGVSMTVDEHESRMHSPPQQGAHHWLSAVIDTPLQGTTPVSTSSDQITRSSARQPTT